MKRLKTNLLIVLSSASFLANAERVIPISSTQILVDYEGVLNLEFNSSNSFVDLILNSKFDRTEFNWGDGKFTLLTFHNNVPKIGNIYDEGLPEELVQVINDLHPLDLNIETLTYNEQLLKKITIDLNDLLKNNDEVKKYILKLEDRGEFKKEINSLLQHETIMDFMMGGCYKIGCYFTTPTRPQVNVDLKLYNDYVLKLIDQRKSILKQEI